MDWSVITHFNRNEAFGDSEKMDQRFMARLDDFRAEVGLPMRILSGYATTGHVENSEHYYGRAVDLRIYSKNGKKPLSMAETFIIAMRAPFYGVGIYSYSWAPFIHLDGRYGGPLRKIWVAEKEG